MLDSLLMERPEWKTRIDTWRVKKAILIQESYEATLPHDPLYRVYVKALCPKVASKINDHRMRNFEGCDEMLHGFVTTDFIESVFGYSDIVFANGGGADCVS